MLSNTSSNVVKISAAGAGKTWDICHEALEAGRAGKRSLIVTYTNRGADSIRKEICKQNNGVLHEKVFIKKWFRFLLSDWIKPYQNYMIGPKNVNIIKSIDFSEAYGIVNKFKTGTIRRYVTIGRNLRSNFVSEMAFYLNGESDFKVLHRLEEIYANIYFDEIQDLAGYDLQLMELLLNSSIGITCCGDNKQATFSTHNARKNKAKTGRNIWAFFADYDKRGNVSFIKNLASRRFNQDICDFANSVHPVGDQITTIMDEVTEHDGVFLIRKEDVSDYFAWYKPQVLRFDAKTDNQGYQTVNFGACKGETFDRVMILPNGPLQRFVLGKAALSTPEKYYVAVTRSKYSIAIVMDKLPDRLEQYVKVDIIANGRNIEALKFVSDMR